MLGAGAGERLAPLTRLRPKVLCPVGNQPLVDHAIERFASSTGSIAVNIHHGRALLESHLAGRVHLSIEEAEPLGTAGALGALRDWIDSRPSLVTNGDTWCPTPMARLVDGWDGERIRILVHGASELMPGVRIAGALMPWRVVSTLEPVPSGLYRKVWIPAERDGRLEVVAIDGTEPCVDCGTPAEYLRANLTWSGGDSVIGAGASVQGTVTESVLWPGAVVHEGEHLRRAIRAHDRTTVLVR